jgi:membrane protease YdiL (CAAX protease family)
VFFAVLALGTAFCEWRLIRAGDSIRNHVGLVLALMWMPAVASTVARLSSHEGARDISFRFGGRPGARMALVGWLFPLAVGLTAYGLAWATGLASYQARAVPGLPASANPTTALLILVAVRLTVGVPIAGVAAAGEEIGWRGYMLTRLIDAGIPRPVLISGVIWACWHLPLVIAGVYASSAHPWVSAVLFLVVIVGQSSVLARLRLASGSVWPAIIGHASWNATIQGVFDFSTVQSPTALWVGESGVLVAVVTALLGVWAVRGACWRMRAPGIPF